jgi:DeoR family ulaG and ulaABCDEF operon transcriptional repressor
MHAAEREKLILEYLHQRGFVSFKDLEHRVAASPATLRRDLERLTSAGLITRVRGGARRAEAPKTTQGPTSLDAVGTALVGVPFHENIHRARPQKEAIGRSAAKLCSAGEAVMIDGGSTTLQMCPHLAGLNMQVLTNSLHIVNALLMQRGTQVLVPAGQVFREQNIILSTEGDDGMQRFHAPRLFMGAASIGPAGLMQADVVLIGAERRFMARADEIIVLVDSSKFGGSSGHIVCPLEDIDIVVTDSGITAGHRAMLAKAGVRVVIARP